MDVKGLRAREQQFLSNDGKIDKDEAKQLTEEVKAGWSPELKKELKALIKRDKKVLDPEAKKELQAATKFKPGDPVAMTDVVRSVTGNDPSSFDDDTVYLGKDGTVASDAGVVPFTRSYDSTQQGPLRMSHGSKAPESTVLSADELAATRAKTPGQALDAAAKVMGADTGTGFEKMAGSSQFYQEGAPYWWGKCHAWSWSSLNQVVDSKVDVKGPEGQRGAWFAGEWMSRADLGNWTMAVADNISLRPKTQFDTEVSAEDLVKGTTQYMMNNGGGVIADVWNDQRHGVEEVWNQPFFAAEMKSETVKGKPGEDLVERAQADGAEFASGVKLLTITGKFGKEIPRDSGGAAYEGEPNVETEMWHVYGVTDATGKMVKAYMADDPALKNIAGLPETSSEAVPDWLWKPNLDAINDTLAGRENRTVENDGVGKQFKFFVGQVLKNGVPGTTRTAFEADVAKLSSGPVDSSAVRELATKYPGVANAYSPEQWQRAFGSRGMGAGQFGAVWPIPQS